MLLNETERGGIYILTLDVKYRSDEEVRTTQFLIRVTGVSYSGNGNVEFTFLASPDNCVYYAYPSQIKPAS